MEYVLPTCSDPAPVWKVHCFALHRILLCCPEHAKTLCAVTQDVSFWLPETGFTENNLCEVVRSKAGDLVESVSLTDEFTNPKKGKTSNCFRIAYRSMERSSQMRRSTPCRCACWVSWGVMDQNLPGMRGPGRGPAPGTWECLLFVKVRLGLYCCSGEGATCLVVLVCKPGMLCVA